MKKALMAIWILLLLLPLAVGQDYYKVRKHGRRVSEFESRIDEIEREMTARIFKSSLDKAEKLHLRRSLMKITRISAATEDATDRLQWVSVKSIV